MLKLWHHLAVRIQIALKAVSQPLPCELIAKWTGPNDYYNVPTIKRVSLYITLSFSLKFAPNQCCLPVVAQPSGRWARPVVAPDRPSVSGGRQTSCSGPAPAAWGAPRTLSSPRLYKPDFAPTSKETPQHELFQQKILFFLIVFDVPVSHHLPAVGLQEFLFPSSDQELL